MTTVASILQSALRETNLIPLGVNPTTAALAEAFGLLSTIVSGVLGNEVGENISPFPLGQNDINSPRGYPWWNNELPGNVFVPTNARIMCNLTAAGSINLHPQPHDGARMGIVDVSGNLNVYPLTIHGNGRMIEGQDEMVYNTAGQVREWVYREDLGNWVTVIPIDLTGNMPFPSEFDDVFIIRLAMRLNPRYGQVMHPASITALKNGESNLSARYGQATTQMPSEIGLLYLTHWNRYWGYGAQNKAYGDPTDFFNSGYPF